MEEMDTNPMQTTDNQDSPSKLHLPTESSLVAVKEVPLMDHSHLKRHSDEGKVEVTESADEKKKMKRRRSSLSTKRRSIVGDLPGCEQPASSSDTASSQGSSTSANSHDPASQENRLQPNPANLKMDAVMEMMKAQIKKLDKENEQWQELLDSHIRQEEESKSMLNQLTLPASMVPEDVKQLALSDYMEVKPLDVQAARDKVKQLLSNIQFDKEACCQDLRLIKSTVEGLQFKNKTLELKLKQRLDEQRQSEENLDTTNLHPADSQRDRAQDPRDAISKFLLH